MGGRAPTASRRNISTSRPSREKMGRARPMALGLRTVDVHSNHPPPSGTSSARAWSESIVRPETTQRAHAGDRAGPGRTSASRRPAPLTSPRARSRSDVRRRPAGGRRYASRQVTTRRHATSAAAGSTGKARPPAAGATINRTARGRLSGSKQDAGAVRRPLHMRRDSRVAFGQRAMVLATTSPVGDRVISRTEPFAPDLRERQPCAVGAQRRKPRLTAPGPELTHPSIGERHFHAVSSGRRR